MAAKNDKLANLHGGDFEALAHDLRRFQGIEKASAVVRDPTRGCTSMNDATVGATTHANLRFAKKICIITRKQCPPELSWRYALATL